MATTADYLTQLQVDKQTLVDNLVAKGVEATSDETFTSLVPKVADIQSGGASFEITDARNLFYNGARIDCINELCSLISNECTNFHQCFYNCSSLTTIPQLNTSNATNLAGLFYDCSSLTTIPQLNTSNATNLSQAFYNCRNLTTIPQLNTSNVTSFNQTFRECFGISEFPQLDTSNATNVGEMFNQCTALTTIPLLDFGKVTTISSIFLLCTKLTTLGGFKDLGKAYSTSRAENYSSYKFDLSYATLLTHESLMNVINNLYDIASIGVKSQSLVIATECQELLTEEEIAIATNKGWNVSFA